MKARTSRLSPSPSPLRARSRSGATRRLPADGWVLPGRKNHERPPAHPYPLRRCSGASPRAIASLGTADSTGTGAESGGVGGLALAGKLHLPVRGRPRARGAGHEAGIPTREAPGPPPRNARATDARPRGGRHAPAPLPEARAGRRVPRGFGGGARGKYRSRVPSWRSWLGGGLASPRWPRGARRADARRAPRQKKKKKTGTEIKFFEKTPLESKTQWLPTPHSLISDRNLGPKFRT